MRNKHKRNTAVSYIKIIGRKPYEFKVKQRAGFQPGFHDSQNTWL